MLPYPTGFTSDFYQMFKDQCFKNYSRVLRKKTIPNFFYEATIKLCIKIIQRKKTVNEYHSWIWTNAKILNKNS